MQDLKIQAIDRVLNHNIGEVTIGGSELLEKITYARRAVRGWFDRSSIFECWSDHICVKSNPSTLRETVEAGRSLRGSHLAQSSRHPF